MPNCCNDCDSLASLGFHLNRCCKIFSSKMNFDENLSEYCCGLEEGSISGNAAAFLRAYGRTCTVMKLMENMEETKKHGLIKDYLEFCYESKDGKITKGKNGVNINFEGNQFESISGNLPDVRNDSVSSLILVEFFTHCCINCIHSIEDVRQVYEEIHNREFGFKVISVHSPKFPREKDLESIKAFCKRMKMDHSAVVNDPECVLWNDLGVTCWPTVLILGPNPDGSGCPNLLFTFMGEDHKDELLMTMKTAMEYFHTKIDIKAAQMNLISTSCVDGSLTKKMQNDEKEPILNFPGKVEVYEDTILISDSGNNRLVVARPTGHIIAVIGGPDRGYKDGNFSQAKFYNTQGVAFENKSTFYVADTGNHAIRKVDLKMKEVSTLIKSNHSLQVKDELVVFKSPWDLCFYDSDTLLIAAAGNHRIFGYFFADTSLYGVERKANTFNLVAGSGREENRNNSYILKASFAQPSGIAIGNGDDKQIYIADSESSSIRSITSKGQVVGVVGGTRDPTDLFAYGDIDGKGINVKLQHPMGVCRGRNVLEVFIADTYNHKIKRIDLTTKECHTITSSGLNEPSGICDDLTQEILYVADTNHHCIKIIDMKNGSAREFELIPAKEQPRREKLDTIFKISPQDKKKPRTVNLFLSPLPDTYEGGQWKIDADSSLDLCSRNGSIIKQENSNVGQISFNITNPDATTEFVIVVDVFFCKASSCLKRTRKIKIEIDSNGTENDLIWDNMIWEP